MQSQQTNPAVLRCSHGFVAFIFRTCLNLIVDRNDEIQEELDLISSLNLLSDFNVSVLPVQGRYKLMNVCGSNFFAWLLEWLRSFYLEITMIDDDVVVYDVVCHSYLTFLYLIYKY